MKLPKGAKLCDWCSGTGKFRDVDSDFGVYLYPAIPICGGCGGIGVQYESKDFKDRVSKICDLRFEYYPTDSLPYGPEGVTRYKALSELVEKVKELVSMYPSLEGSFAKVVEKDFQEYVEILKEGVDENISWLKNTEPKDEVQKVTKDGVIAYYSGNTDEGERLYKEALEKYPESSEINHDLGALTMKFRRNPEAALPYFIRSTELEPKKALHFVQTADTLLLLKKPEEALKFLKESQKQPDYEKEITKKKRIAIAGIIAASQGIEIHNN
jgi:tetratricopeptide (TPR) repeat protein